MQYDDPSKVVKVSKKTARLLPPPPPPPPSRPSSKMLIFPSADPEGDAGAEAGAAFLAPAAVRARHHAVLQCRLLLFGDPPVHHCPRPQVSVTISSDISFHCFLIVQLSLYIMFKCYLSTNRILAAEQRGYASGIIRGGNARCVGMLTAFKDVRLLNDTLHQ